MNQDFLCFMPYACEAKSKANECYTCGSCNKAFKTICKLHLHLICHGNGGSYHYNHQTNTAYPRFDSVCVGSQTDFGEVSTTHAIQDKNGTAFNSTPSNVMIKGDPYDSDDILRSHLDVRKGNATFANNVDEAYMETKTDVIRKHDQDNSGSLPGIKENIFIQEYPICDHVTNHSYVEKQVFGEHLAQLLEKQSAPIENGDENIQMNIEDGKEYVGTNYSDKVSNSKPNSSSQQIYGFYRDRISLNNDTKEVIQRGNVIPRDECNKTVNGYSCHRHLQSYCTQPSIMIGQLYKNVSNQTTESKNQIKIQSESILEKARKTNDQTLVNKDLAKDFSIACDDVSRVKEKTFNLNKQTTNGLCKNNLNYQRSTKEVMPIEIDQNKQDTTLQKMSNLCSRNQQYVNKSNQTSVPKDCVKAVSDGKVNEVEAAKAHSSVEKLQHISKSISRKASTDSKSFNVTCPGCYETVDCEDIETHPCDEIRYRWKCMYCGLSLFTETEYRNHLKMHKETGSKKHVQCDDCGKTVTKHYFRDHKTYHCVNKEKISCEECGEVICKLSLKKHMAYVHSRKAFSVCEICGRSVKHLGIHIRGVHEKKKRQRQKCEVCNKTFADRFCLNKHKLIHNSAGKNQCSFCGKLFHQRSNMRAHMRQHTNEKPFKCDICGEGFTHNVSKKNHMAKHHK